MARAFSRSQSLDAAAAQLAKVPFRLPHDPAAVLHEVALDGARLRRGEVGGCRAMQAVIGRWRAATASDRKAPNLALGAGRRLWDAPDPTATIVECHSGVRMVSHWCQRGLRDGTTRKRAPMHLRMADTGSDRDRMGSQRRRMMCRSHASTPKASMLVMSRVTFVSFDSSLTQNLRTTERALPQC
jgi:hypothetical protein